jgi:NADH dehydrogenase
MGKKVVVLGAGYAGVLTAKKLAKKLKNSGTRSHHRPEPLHTMLTELHEVAAARVDETSVRIELEKVFEAERARRHRRDRERRLRGKQLVGKRGTYPYDYLVLASGSKRLTSGAGSQRAQLHPLVIHDAIRLRERIFDAFRQADASRIRKKRELLRFSSWARASRAWR